MNHIPNKASPRVVIRHQMPLHMRLIAVLVFIILLLVLSWGMYTFGIRSANTMSGENVISDVELKDSYDLTTCLQKDKKEQCTLLAKFARKLQMNKAEHHEMTKQIKFLGDENDRLKEELVYFQHLMSNTGDTASGISINRFELKQGSNVRQYRYTLLLTQGGQRPKDFKGSLKLLVTLRQKNEKKVVVLSSGNASKSIPVNFKHYERVERSFQVPENAVVENIQVQVFENGKSKVKLTKTVKLSS